MPSVDLNLDYYRPAYGWHLLALRIHKDAGDGSRSAHMCPQVTGKFLHHTHTYTLCVCTADHGNSTLTNRNSTCHTP